MYSPLTFDMLTL